MRLSSIALGHLSRGKARAAFVVLGLALGVATAVALSGVSTALERHLGEELDRYGANIVVAPRTGGLEVTYGGVTVSGVSYDVARLTTDDDARIRSIAYANRLAVVSPVLVGAADVDGRQAALAGLHFKDETILKPWWRVYGAVPASADEVLVGYDAARELGLVEPEHEHAGQYALTPVAVDPYYDVSTSATGAAHEHAASSDAVVLTRDSVTVAGRPLRVAGILAPTGSADDRLVFADLGRAQELLGRPGEVSLFEVSALCSGCPVEDMVAQIAAALPTAKVTAVQQAVAARSMAVGRVTRFGAGLAAVVLTVAALLVFVTVTSSIAERRREIGVLRAVGFRRSHVLTIIGLEVALLGALGGALGWLGGWVAASAVVRVFADGAATGVAPDPVAAAAAVAGAVLVASAGALWPALTASKLDPTEALRYV